MSSLGFPEELFRIQDLGLQGNPLEFIRFLGKASLSLLGSGQGKLEFIRFSIGISMISTILGFRSSGQPA